MLRFNLPHSYKIDLTHLTNLLFYACMLLEEIWKVYVIDFILMKKIESQHFLGTHGLKRSAIKSERPYIRCRY